MNKAKYAPEEIDRLIDEKIARIDAKNSLDAAEALRQSKSQRQPWPRKMLNALLTLLGLKKKASKHHRPKSSSTFTNHSL